MSYFLYIHKGKYGNYYSFKTNYRENGKVKSKYVYLGNEETALKILADFHLKKPLNERLLSYSGELILSKVFEQLDLRAIVNKAVRNGAKLDAGRFVEMFVVERALNCSSKWALAENVHGNSIFSLDETIPKEKFTEANIYHYMDYLHPVVDQVQQALVKNLLAMKGMEPREIIIDGTSLYSFGDDGEDVEVDDDDGDTAGEGQESDPASKYDEIKRVHGYSRDKRFDLAQVNVMLGVSDCSVPLFFETFAGNAPDVHMFKRILEKCKQDYAQLLARARGKYIVFDKGNNNDENFAVVDALCAEHGFHFVASIRPSLTVIKKELGRLAFDDLPVVYEQERTVLRGTTVSLSLYGKARHVLLYVNVEIREKKLAAFREKLARVEAAIKEQNVPGRDAKETNAVCEALLRKHGVLTCYERHEKGGKFTCTRIDHEVEARLAQLGKFAIMTDDASLAAADVARIYKATGIVEQEFHLLKSELSVRPFYHSKPERILVHVALVLWGMMALAVLKHQLGLASKAYTFEQLRAKIQEGKVSMGDYVYPDGKIFRIRKALNMNHDLLEIFRLLKLKLEYFEIDVVPTAEEIQAPGDRR